jgi:ubiquinone/menaquinone biosynthesis C-methylase UbiE
VQSFTDTGDVDTATDDYARRFAGTVGSYFLDVQSRALLDLLATYSGARVLDVGGGHAQAVGPLTEHDHRVVVLGSSLGCRARLERLMPAGSYAYATASLLALPFADCSFDVVLALRLMSHVVHWRELVEEMCRVARHAVIVDYAEKRSLNLFGSALFRWKQAAERNTRLYRSFHQSELKRAFAAHGFADTAAYPELFFPMVLHRMLHNRVVTERIESASRVVGATRYLGSPVVLRAARRGLRTGGNP